MRHVLLPLSCLVLLVSTAAAQEWTRFRGPNGTGNGTISGLPARFTPADYDWIVPLSGSGHSSPVLWGEKIFLTLQGRSATQREVACFDATNGKQLWSWSAPLEAHNLHNFNNFASATPTVDAERVYVVWGSGEKTQAVTLTHEGEPVWNREWPSFSSDHGYGSSPILEGGRLVFHTDSVNEGKSRVVCLDPASGKTLWEVERVTPVPDEKHLTAYNTPAILESDGRSTVVAFQTNDGWKGLDLETGEVRWSFAGDYSHRSVGSIAVGEGIVFASVGSGGKGRAATALRPGSGSEPEVLYDLGLTDGLGYVPTPLIHDGRLYLWGDTGILTCRDLLTGELVYEQRINGNFFSSPVLADDKIFCASRDGEMVAVSAGKTFEVLGRSRFASGVNATPAIANNCLYLRTDTHLICIRGR